MNLMFLPLTIGVYLAAVKLQRRYPTPVLNPVLVSLICLMALVLLTHSSYQDYRFYSHWLSDLLQPAVVALGVPLYLQLRSIAKALPKILLTAGLSALLAVSSTILIALVVKSSPLIAASLAPKSVTTPIAVIISESIAGVPALTAIAVILTGLIGAIFGPFWLTKIGVREPTARGIAMGIACHALGTAQIAQENEQAGAYSALALVLSAIFTALICPVVAGWLL
jgi:predicted murein hydrolase (TIGR00659 family)